MSSETDLRSRGLWLLKACTRRLIGFLSHQDPQVRSEGAKALGEIGDSEGVLPLIEALKHEKQDEQMPLALARIGDLSALPFLLQAFNQAEREARPNIATALGSFKDSRAVASLVSGLADPDPNVRFNCISSLGKLKDPSAVSPLLGCLGEANEWIFLNVVDSLARIGDHRATNPLIAFYLKEGNERKRAAIIVALGIIGDLTSIPTLSKALRDSDDRVKANAIESLRRLDLPREKLQTLVQPFLKHPNNRVRGNAIVTIAAIGTTDLTSLLEFMRDDSDKWTRATLGYVLSVIDHPKAMQMLVHLMKDEDGDVKKNAARGIFQKAKDDQTDFLIKLLSDPTPFVRLQAVQTLGRIRAVVGVPWLSRLFGSERNFKIRSAIVAALGDIKDNSAIALLQSALKDQDSRVRANAVEAIEKLLRSEGALVLKPLLGDPDNRTRSNAAKALFRAGDVTVLTDLEKMLNDTETPTMLSGAYALGQIGQSLRELERSPLLEPLKSSLGEVKSQEPKVPGKTEPPPTSESRLESEVPGNERFGVPQVPPPSEGTPKIPAGTPEVSAGAQPVSTLRPVPKVHNPPTGTTPPTVGKEAMREQFLDHFNNGRYKNALESAEAYIAQFPFDLMANFFIGNLYFQLSRFDDAIRFFKKTTEIDPFHVQAYSNLGISCYRSGRIQEAIHYFKQALKIQPDLSVLRFNLANLLLKENKWEEAILQYEDGKRYQKAPAKVLANLAFAYQKTGQYEKAILNYEESAQIDARDPGVFYNWGLILARQGKKAEAQEVLHRGLKSVPPGSAGLKTLRELLDRLKA